MGQAQAVGILHAYILDTALCSLLDLWHCPAGSNAQTERPLGVPPTQIRKNKEF